MSLSIVDDGDASSTPIMVATAIQLGRLDVTAMHKKVLGIFAPMQEQGELKPKQVIAFFTDATSTSATNAQQFALL